MLQKFKQLLSPTSKFCKKIIESSLLTNNDEVYLEDLLFLISCFEQTNEEFIYQPPFYYMEEYFKTTLKNISNDDYHKKTKMLLTVHLMLHEYQIGLDFSAIFLDQKIAIFQDKQYISNQQFIRNDSKLFVSLNVHLPYFQYLQRLALNIQVFHACKIQQYPLQEGKKNIDVQTKIIWLFKISNIVNNGLGQMNIIKECVVIHPKEQLVKEIVLVFWSDMIVYYNFLSKEIMSLTEYYRHLSPNLCLQFYELYMQLIQIRQSIGDLYRYRQHFDKDNIIRQPRGLEITKPLHQDIENFVISQRIQQNKMNREKGLQTERQQTESTNHLHKRNKTNNLPPYMTNELKCKLVNGSKSINENTHKHAKQIQTERNNNKNDDEPFDQEFEKLKILFQEQNLSEKIAQQKQKMVEIDLPQQKTSKPKKKQVQKQASPNNSQKDKYQYKNSKSSQIDGITMQPKPTSLQVSFQNLNKFS